MSDPHDVSLVCCDLESIVIHGSVVERAFAEAIATQGIVAGTQAYVRSMVRFDRARGRPPADVMRELFDADESRALAASLAFDRSFSAVAERFGVTASAETATALGRISGSGVKVCMLSVLSHSASGLIFDRFRQQGLADLVLGADDARHEAAMPDLVHTAMRRLSVEDAREVAMVSATEHGVRAGGSAGVGMVVGVGGDDRHRSALRRAGATHLVDSITGLPGLVTADSRHALGLHTLEAMPELPEVEALAAFLRGRARGHVVARADAASFAVLKTFDPPLTALGGLTVGDIGRHGKFLDLSVGDLHLVIHLARAGWLRWREDIPEKHARPGKSPLAFRLVLDDKSGFDLTEAGTRKRLAVYLVHDPREVPGVATLGPEPMSDTFTVESLSAILRDRRTQVKGVLRDQHIIAGIGNAYSDEVLHAAKMSPFKLASSFTPEDVAKLHAAIVTTLSEAVDRGAGLAAADLKGEKKTGLRVHGKAGQPCPVCGDTIREVSFADSALQYCPTCQTGGKPLADRRLSRLLK
jgi:formamidopyrimidine-DNA glycosylase